MNRFADGHHTGETPKYKWNGSKLWKAVAVAVVLIVINIAMMPLFMNTAASDLVFALYQFSSLIGAVVLGGLISLGRIVGSKALQENNLGLGIVGVLLTQLAFGVFGGLVLQLYPNANHTRAILIAGAITAAITAVIAVYIYTRDVDFQKYAKYAGLSFIGGLVLLLLSDVFGGGVFGMMAFGLILLGWLFDLAWEIGMSASERRTPLANGFALYVAFTGVFIHILQLVLESES